MISTKTASNNVDERYQRLNLDIDLEPYKDQLLNRSGNSKYCPIDPNTLLEIVPALARFNSLMNEEGWQIYKPKTMTLYPRSWAPPHIDASPTGNAISLGMNIPIQNGTSMITRWYNLPKKSNLLWEETQRHMDQYNIDPKDLIRDYGVDSFLLDGIYAIKTDEPHNVDGRSSLVTRSILSIRWIHIETEELLTWNDRSILHNASNKMSNVLVDKQPK